MRLLLIFLVLSSAHAENYSEESKKITSCLLILNSETAKNEFQNNIFSFRYECFNKYTAQVIHWGFETKLLSEVMHQFTLIETGLINSGLKKQKCTPTHRLLNPHYKTYDFVCEYKK